MWVLYGVLILVVHVALMFLLSKIFRWDLCMVSTASVANIGGSASAPIIACAYNDSFAGIGVIMGVLGAAIGMFLYKMIVRDTLVNVMSTCLHKMMWFVFRVLQILLKPVKRLIYAGKTFVLYTGNELKKCKNFIKKRLTVFIKTIRMVLCKR